MHTRGKLLAPFLKSPDKELFFGNIHKFWYFKYIFC